MNCIDSVRREIVTLKGVNSKVETELQKIELELKQELESKVKLESELEEKSAQLQKQKISINHEQAHRIK